MRRSSKPTTFFLLEKITNRPLEIQLKHITKRADRFEYIRANRCLSTFYVLKTALNTFVAGFDPSDQGGTEPPVFHFI
jgi:hypothetical protein